MNQQSVPAPVPHAGIKTSLSGLGSTELQVLEGIYQDRWRRDWLKTTGWVNLFLGGFTLWLGLSGDPTNSLPGQIQFVIGLLIFGQSLWAIVSPGTRGFLGFAVVFLVAGVWNILLAIIDGFAGLTFLVGLFGIAQLRWASQTYRIYQRYQQMGWGKPQMDAVPLYDAIWWAITTRSQKDDETSISFWMGRSIWQGLLLDDRAFFALIGQKMLVIKSKSDTLFEPKNPREAEKTRVNGWIQLNGFLEGAVMNRDFFQKYRLWKSGKRFHSKPALSKA